MWEKYNPNPLSKLVGDCVIRALTKALDRTFVLGTGSHAVTVCSGRYYDAWESGKEIPIYYWKRKED